MPDAEDDNRAPRHLSLDRWPRHHADFRKKQQGQSDDGYRRGIDGVRLLFRNPEADQQGNRDQYATLCGRHRSHGSQCAAHRFLAAFYAHFFRRYQPSRQQEQHDRRHGIVQRFGQPDDHYEGEYRQNPLSGYGESVRQGHQCNRQGYDHGDHYGDRERFGGRC